MNARYQVMMILSAMLMTAVTILLFGEKAVSYSSLVACSALVGLGTFCCLRMPGKPYWVQVTALLPGSFINDTNERHETALQLAVLSATDTISPRQGDALPIVRLLLQHGADARGCLNAIVERHELNFEATDRDSPAYSTAVAHSVELIPLLSAAGDTISAEALSSARYNCAPAIQQALMQVKQTPVELPEE